MSLIDIHPSERLEGVGEYFFSKKLREIDGLRAQGREIISLGVGSPDLPPAAGVIETLAREAAKPGNHGYQSYVGAPVLRNAAAAWYARRYGVALDPASEILPLVGSKEGLMHICMAYLNKGDKVLVPNPGYPTYTSAVALSGGVCEQYRLTAAGGWMPDFEAIEKQGLQGVKMMMVNYPQMPTGAKPTVELFERIVAFGRRHNILIVHDNPYSFIRNDKPLSLLQVEGAKEVAIELNSLSKSHNMAGWRIGFLLADSQRVQEVLRFKSNMDSGMFYPLQAAAAYALSLGDEWYASVDKVYRGREELGYKIMEAIGCVCEPDQAGLFIWGRLPEGVGDCYRYSDKLLYEKGVFITPGGIFGSEGNDYMRVSLCADERTLTNALNKIKE